MPTPTPEELLQKINRLEDELAQQTEKTEQTLEQSRRAAEFAMHAYRVDHYGFIWVWDIDAKDYKKTNMRVMNPVIADRALQSRHIADNAVEGRHMQDNAVSTEKIGDGEVKSRNIAPEAITTDKIDKGAVTTDKLADESITGDEIGPGAATNGKIANDAVQTRNIKDRNVTSKKIDLNAIKPEHVSPATFRELAKDLQNQIDSLEIAGVAVSNEFGTATHISISQKTMTDAINKLWQKLEDMTGEVLQGISMSVSPDYFISEDGCSVHISANTVDTNGIFEHIAFYANGTLIAEADNVDFFEYETEITETTIIKCVAKIMGVEYTRQQIVTHYNSFWLGAGNTYLDIMDVEHVIPITNGMRGAYNVDIAQGQHIIIVVGESLASGFLRADLNGVEIPFTESTVTIDDKDYRVFTSENTYNAGTLNIDING